MWKGKYERHPRHGAALAGCLENLDDNDTSAKITAAGVASGVCCSGERCGRASGSLARRSKHIPAHTGGEKIKKHGR